MIATIRILLIAAGLWCAYFGINMFVHFPPADLMNIVEWFAGGIILHDFVFAPLCAIVGLGARKILPRAWWVPVAYGAVCTVVLGGLAVPVLMPHSTFGNPTVIDRDYPLGLTIALGVIWLLVIAATIRAARRKRPAATVTGG
jgi:hypothetical protein